MKARRLSVLVVPLLLFAVACGGGSAGGGTDSSGKAKVTLTLNWYPYGEHAPFYYGKKQGIFAQHGIDLTIRAGQGSTKTVQATATGRTQFGWADTAAMLPAVGSGMSVKSVGVFLQTTPASVESLCEKNIRKPQDLVGKKIASTPGDAPTVTFPAFLKANGIKSSDVHLQNIDPAGKIAAVISGRVDALLGFAHDQGPTIANKSGKKVCYMRYSDYGVQYYSNGLLASDEVIEDDAEVVREMVAATSEAFTAAQQHPEDAVAAMDGVSPQLPPEEVLLQSWQETMKLLHTSTTKGDAPGVNTEQDWQHTIDVFAKAGMLKNAGEPTDYWDSGFAPKG